MPQMTIVAAEGSELEYNIGSGWQKVHYVGDITASGGEAPETDITSLDREGKISGTPRVPSLNIAIASYVPVLQQYKDIQGAGGLIQWRISTKQNLVHSPESTKTETAAIATDGVVTFAGDDAPKADEIGEGMILRITGETADYIIDKIPDTLSSDSKLSVRPVPSSAVSAEAYKIFTPTMRITFGADLSNAPGNNFALPAGGHLNSSMVLSPRASLPNWEIVVPK